MFAVIDYLFYLQCSDIIYPGLYCFEDYDKNMRMQQCETG